MVIKGLNRKLNAAKASKQDEFYTQLSDIEKELWHYKEHFKGKVILCNCDDPRLLAVFLITFLRASRQLRLKKLISTCYKNDQPNMFSRNSSEKGISLEYTGDKDGNRIPDDDEIEKHRLKGNGDFRSPECVELLGQSDIVVTNPPFSLFREYVTHLAESGKKFLVIGNHHAITYGEIFKLIKENKLWLGYTQPSAFVVPDDYEMRAVRSWRDAEGRNWRSLGNACWFTNLDIQKRHDDLILYKQYTPEEYPNYDNYDAIEVSKVAEIPKDYAGVMGVPVTFLDKYNPDQFEIVGSNRGIGQDPKGIYGRGSHLSGKETFKRLFIRNKRISK